MSVIYRWFLECSRRSCGPESSGQLLGRCKQGIVVDDIRAVAQL